MLKWERQHTQDKGSLYAINHIPVGYITQQTSPLTYASDVTLIMRPGFNPLVSLSASKFVRRKCPELRR